MRPEKPPKPKPNKLKPKRKLKLKPEKPLKPKRKLKLKPEKCKLFQKEVAYLGHIVSSSGVATDPDKVTAVKNWPTPKCVPEVRSFLGFVGYYRRFCPDFATVAKTLEPADQQGDLVQMGTTGGRLSGA